jgi:homoserine O-succinyltransferase
MPIILPRDLPAWRTLSGEGITVFAGDQLPKPSSRPLQVLLLNLMPTKVVTETQIARVLSNSPLPVELTLLRTATHAAGHADPNHLRAFYRTFAEIRDRRFDGLIITGAPVETLPWHEVDYWGEISDILAWSADTAMASLFICWGAQAALQHFYGIGKRALPAKRFGIPRPRATRSPPIPGWRSSPTAMRRACTWCGSRPAAAPTSSTILNTMPTPWIANTAATATAGCPSPCR